MGADLITAVAAWPQDTTLDFEAGREATKNLVQADVPEHILDGVIGYDLDYDDEGNLSAEGLKELREVVLGAVGEVENMVVNRHSNVAMYNMFSHTVLILAESTWGDTPEGYDELVAVVDIEPVAKAMGFNPNAYT